jgi:hypothetical protein
MYSRSGPLRRHGAELTAAVLNEALQRYPTGWANVVAATSVDRRSTTSPASETAKWPA